MITWMPAIIGGAITISGILLINSGLTKSRQLKGKYSGLSMDVRCSPAMTGFTLRYTLH